MRTLVLLCVSIPLATAQPRQSVTTVRDLNGRIVDWQRSESSTGHSAQTLQSVNGRRVPVEDIQERTISKDGNRTVVERLIKRYDPNGAPLPAEKVLIETTARSDGSSTQTATTFRADLNGTLRPLERAQTETTKSGDTTLSNVAVERASINGGFELRERRAIRETATKTTSERDETVSTRDANGQFIPTARTVARSSIVGNETRIQTDEYESATSGSLRLHRQALETAVKNPDGTARREIDVFGVNSPGRALAPGAPLQLRERQIFTSRQSPDGSTVEVFAIQRPSLTASKSLGPATTISETTTSPTPSPRP